ncbi:hypothetical protein K1T71_005723 [Dendrolimus kikuchii]|uniref:Uncharacterized protein n=1 Tax=Dendrolimus kikuchii TaxID=765133 RepID=A0ACC1D5S9_9NEOP|nr:hypothetical protein K1T71_005723 [Dendrolimus kikuchii]
MIDSDINETLKLVHECILPKLYKTNEECAVHPEYEVRLKILDQKFHQLLRFMGAIQLKEEITVLASLKILYEELECDGPWNNLSCKEFAKKLNGTFELFYGITLKNIFSSDTFDCQKIFDACLKIIHEKISMENFKYYPSLVEVYCIILQSSKEYNLSLNPPKVLPVSLYLIDDYINSNRIKGLKGLCAVLKCLEPQTFSDGNYYDVIYRSLKNKVSEKDLEITKPLLDCLLLLLKILPQDVKSTKMDDILSVALEQLYIESNLYRKALLLNFLKNIIEMHGVSCVKRKKFKHVFCDNLDICCNDAVAEILLSDLLRCFEMWIRHCWCVWKLSTDQKLLSLLVKLLYVTTEEYWTKIAHLIITLIKLCSVEERKQISENLNTSKFCNSKFLERLELIKREIDKQIEIVY